MRKIISVILFYTFFLIYMIILVESLPMTTLSSTVDDRIPTVISKHVIINHLTKYGYLSEKKPPRTGKDLLSIQSPTNTYTDKELEAALKDYQEFMNLPITGRADDKTLNNMNKSRCGVKDKTPPTNLRVKMVLTSSGRRKKRFVQNNKFKLKPRTEFWYLVNPRPKNYLIVTSLYHQLEYAFNMWAGVSNLVFIRGDTQRYSDIQIGFYSGAHGDNENFDGKGGIAAHPAVKEKIIHFDEDENWTSYRDDDTFRWLHPRNGSDFIQCAMHEIGHILGLPHINDTLSAMHPTLQKFPYLDEYSLSKTDVERVQAIYGSCEPPKFDAIFTNTWEDGRTYIIVGPYVYQFNDAEKRVEYSWPRSTTLRWYGSPFPDEVFWNTDYFLYWFVNDEYYIYSPKPNFPTARMKIGRSMSTGRIGWIGLQESKVDAALVIKEGNFVFPYIFRRNLVYRMISIQDLDRPQLPLQKVEIGWPKKITEMFPGIPDDLDTAFTWGFDGNSYFFKGRYFQIWDPNSIANTKILYEIHQWKNVCDVYKCQIGPRKNFYKCESWAYTKRDCHYCGPKAT